MSKRISCAVFLFLASWAIASCGAYTSTNPGARHGTVSAHLVFPGLHDGEGQPLEAVSLAAPDPSAQVQWVLLAAVQGGSTVSSERFPYDDHGGTLAVPQGTGYEIQIRGIDSVGEVTFFSHRTGVDVTANQDTPLGTVVMTPARPLLFFSGVDSFNGYELWYFDADSWNAWMVTDINGTSSGSLSSRGDFAVYRGELFFSADDGVNGWELWAHSGVNTRRVSDIQGGAVDNLLNTAPTLGPYNGELFFLGSDAQAGSVLFSYNGATVSVAASISATTAIGVYDDDLYVGFQEQDGVKLGRFNAGGTFEKVWGDGYGATGLFLEPYAGKLYFTVATSSLEGGLWAFDGLTPPSRVAALDVEGSPSSVSVCGSKIYFAADDGVRGRELWAYDAAAHSYTLAADIWPGGSGSAPFGPMTTLSSKLYLTADDGVHGRELWELDCGNLSSRMVTDINPVPGAGSSPGPLRAHEGTLYFGADDGSGHRLWYFRPPSGGDPGAVNEIMEAGSAVPAIQNGRGLVPLDPFRPPSHDLSGRTFTAQETVEADSCAGRSGSVLTWNYSLWQTGAAVVMNTGTESINGLFRGVIISFDQLWSQGSTIWTRRIDLAASGTGDTMLGDASLTAYQGTTETCSAYSTLSARRGDWHEPNNVANLASAILPGLSQKHRLSPVGDVDWIRFQGVGGSTYTIRTHGNQDTSLTLYGTDGTTTLASDNDSGDGQNALINWTSPADGTYYFKVEENSGGVGPYALTLNSGDVFEPDDSFAFAGSIANGESQDRTLDPSGDEDWVRIDAIGTTRYTIQTFGTTDTYLLIYGADGTSVLTSNDNGAGDGLNARITNFYFPSSGTYFLQIRAANGISKGGYSLSVSGGDPYEPDNSPAGAFSINPTDEGQTQRSLDPSGDVDYLYFRGVEGSMYTHYVGGTSVPDTFLTLYDQNGTDVLATDDNSGDGYKNPHIQWTCPSNAFYFLKVEAADGVETGQYSIYSVGGDFFEPDNSWTEAKTILLGTANAQNHTLDPVLGYSRHSDWVKFSAVSGYDYILETSGTTDTFLVLYGTDHSAVLATDNDGAGAGSNASITWTCPAAGTYYAEVKGGSGTVIGPYSISVVEDSGGVIVEW